MSESMNINYSFICIGNVTLITPSKVLLSCPRQAMQLEGDGFRLPDNDSDLVDWSLCPGLEEGEFKEWWEPNLVGPHWGH